MKKALFLLVVYVCGIGISSAQERLHRQKINGIEKVKTTAKKIQISEQTIPLKSNWLKERQNSNVVTSTTQNGVTINRVSSETDPIASYRRPQGFFYSGFNENLDYYPLLLGPAYTDVTWKNTSLYADTYNWELPNPKTGIFYTSNKINPTEKYESDIFETPRLTARSASKTSKPYYWGSECTDENGNPDPFETSFFSTGIDIDLILEDETIGVGNYSPFGNIGAFNVNDNGKIVPVFGPNGIIASVANYFEKPLQPYLLDKVSIPLVNLKAPANTRLSLSIYSMNNNIPEKLVASSHWITTKAINTEATGEVLYYLKFDEFKMLDPETELEISADYLEIDDAILIELSWSDEKPGLAFNLLSQIEEGIESNAYIFLPDDSDPNSFWLLNSTDYIDEPAALVFDLFLSYPFLHTEDNHFAAPEAGGIKNFKINSFWVPEIWELASELPNWIKLGEPSIDQQTGVVTLPATVSALPAGVSGRKADIKIKSMICDLTLQFKQGDAWFTGITLVQTTKATAICQGDNFLLTYPDETTSVALYNITGQKIAQHTLNPQGTSVIPVANLPKGIYVLKFAGKIEDTIKVIK